MRGGRTKSRELIGGQSQKQAWAFAPALREWFADWQRSSPIGLPFVLFALVALVLIAPWLLCAAAAVILPVMWLRRHSGQHGDPAPLSPRQPLSSAAFRVLNSTQFQPRKGAENRKYEQSLKHLKRKPGRGATHDLLFARVGAAVVVFVGTPLQWKAGDLVSAALTAGTAILFIAAATYRRPARESTTRPLSEALDRILEGDPDIASVSLSTVQASEIENAPHGEGNGSAV
jgi:hypothetical protein